MRLGDRHGWWMPQAPDEVVGCGFASRVIASSDVERGRAGVEADHLATQLGVPGTDRLAQGTVDALHEASPRPLAIGAPLGGQRQLHQLRTVIERRPSYDDQRSFGP